jgi:PAS domain S-box-containing protein
MLNGEHQRRVRRAQPTLHEPRTHRVELEKRNKELRARNRLLDAVLEHTHMMTVYLDTRFNFVWVNSIYAETCKHPPSFFLGKNHFDLYPHAENQEIFQRVVDTGEPFSAATKPFVFPDQPERGVTYWDWSLIPVKNAKGRSTGLVFTMAEVTDRVRTEQRLRDSEENMRYIVKHDPNAIAVYDRGLHYIAVSDRYLQDYGVKEEDIIGKHHYQVFPEMPQRWKDVHQRCLAGAIERNDDDYFDRPDGTVTYNRWECRPWRRVDGEIGGIILYTEVTTERKKAEKALKEREALFRRMFDQSPIGAGMVSLDHRFLMVNEALCRITGYSAEELISRSVAEVTHPDDVDSDAVQARRLEAGEIDAYDIDTRYLRSDGVAVWIHLNVRLIRDEDGRALYFLPTMEDIAERVRGEEALRQSEERFQQLFDHMAEGVAVYQGVDEGRDFIFVDMNSPGQSISKVLREQVIGRRVTEVFPAVEAMGLLEVLRRVWRTGQPEHHPLTEYVDGRVAQWMENYVYKLPSGLIVAIYSDTSETRQAEAERERLMAAIEQAGEVVIITNPDGIIQYVNPAFETVTGYSREEAVGRNPRFLQSGEQDHAFYTELWHTISSGKSWQGTLVNKRKEGTLSTVDATISPVSDAGGRIVSYVAAMRDITAQRLMEDQLRQSQKIETVGQLAGGVAHDFNNMLQVIVSYVEMSLAKVEAGQPLQKYLLEIRRAAQRSAEITGQLLTFARKQTVSPKVLDLNDAVANTQKMIQRLIGEDIDLAWMPGHGLWKVKIDPAQLDQILANLAVNARDAIGGVGRLTIETENVSFDQDYCAAHPGFSPGAYLMLAVSDDGCGMDEQVMSHLFEPFFTTKEPGKGTGLGLATIYGIVKQNNGFIKVYSEPGHGTTFKVYLPRAEGESAAERVEAEAGTTRGGTETVLVVEDEAAILELARESLEQLGYTVLTAGSPGEAIRLTHERAGPIQLLITDVVMPQMNGRQLAERLTAARPGLKCLYMSGYTADAIAHRGVLEEGVRFIAKPFSLSVLAAKVREMLDG